MSASAVDTNRWTFTVATPAGDVRSTYVLTAEAIAFDSDSAFDGGGVSVPWAAIREAGTAVVDLPVGKGAPDLGRYVPARIEWLIATRSDVPGKPFQRPLPPAPERDALIEAVRERLGGRWVGEGMPLIEARKRFGIEAAAGENLKVVGIVLGVLALLFLLLLGLAFLMSPVFLFPAGFLFGGWLFRSGLTGLTSAIAIANTPTAKVSSAAIGLVELEGRATTRQPVASAVSGRPCLFWDVAVEAWHVDSDRNGEWRQLAARHGGQMGVIELEDATGRIPIWLRQADVLLHEQIWVAGTDRLPQPGAALLEEMGFAWSGELRVREQRLEVDAPLYVIGTLDERGSLPAVGSEGRIERVMSIVRTGEWRTRLVRVLPRPLAMLVAVLFGFLGILFGVGRGGERAPGANDVPPPDMPDDKVLVWKGRAGRPFIVSSGIETDVVPRLRTRSLYLLGGGIAVLCYCLYELLQLS